jgi:hypothetical protein
MQRRYRPTGPRPQTTRQGAAFTIIAVVIAAAIHALAQVGVHPVIGLMATAIAAAVTARLTFRRFAAAIGGRLQARSRATQRKSLLPTRQDAARGSRWRRLEAARTSLAWCPRPAKSPGPSAPEGSPSACAGRPA